MNLDLKEIRKMIDFHLPEGLCVPRHNERGHFYEVNRTLEESIRRQYHGEGVAPLKFPMENPIYPSVTGKLQIVKDEGLINYKMNRAIEYVFANWKEFSDANIMEHLDKAGRVSADILTEAGDIGRMVHDTRERYFKDWILKGEKPGDILSYIKPEDDDIRVVSCLRALDKFLKETGYVPVKTELLVYSHALKVAGTLDDLGMMEKVLHEGEADCAHDFMEHPTNKKRTCIKCGRQWRYEFVLLDLKTSNQFKDHYFFQVALYYWMFKELTGLRPERCLILKVSKEDGSYRIEDLYRHASLASYARSMVRTHSGLEFIKSLRKDNQKEVAPLMKI